MYLKQGLRPSRSIRSRDPSLSRHYDENPVLAGRSGKRGNVALATEGTSNSDFATRATREMPASVELCGGMDFGLSIQRSGSFDSANIRGDVPLSLLRRPKIGHIFE